MPVVRGKHFAYTPRGMQEAQEYAARTGAKVQMKPPGRRKARGKRPPVPPRGR